MRLLAFVFSLFLLLASSALANEIHFIRAIDGDSVELSIHGKKTEIRLIGIDAPEWKQEWSKAATRFTASFLSKGELTIEYGKVRKDKYGRTLAYVYSDDTMINRQLVAHGLALAYPIPPNLKYAKQIRKTEIRARATKKGFWKYGGLKLTPHEFRKRHKH